MFDHIHSISQNYSKVKTRLTTTTSLTGSDLSAFEVQYTTRAKLTLLKKHLSGKFK